MRDGASASSGTWRPRDNFPFAHCARQSPPRSEHARCDVPWGGPRVACTISSQRHAFFSAKSRRILTTATARRIAPPPCPRLSPARAADRLPALPRGESRGRAGRAICRPRGREPRAGRAGDPPRGGRARGRSAIGGEKGVPLAEIVQATSLARPTVHRIVHVLIEEGIVERSERTGNYVVGRQVPELALARPSRSPLLIAAEPHLAAASAKLGDTLFLTAAHRARHPMRGAPHRRPSD